MASPAPSSTSSAPAAAPRRGTSPFAFFVLGSILIVFWFLASLLRIQTSEAFLLNGPTVSFVPDWTILMQIPDLFLGHLTPTMAKAALWGWGIEVLYLVCVVGFEVAHESVHHANPKIARCFGTVVLLIIGFDAWADYQYGSLPSGFWGQIGFAVITSLIVLLFGVIGLHFLEKGWHEFTR